MDLSQRQFATTSRGVGAGLDEGRRSRYSNWNLGDEAVYTDPLHEFLFNSGSPNLEGSDWLKLQHVSISSLEFGM